MIELWANETERRVIRGWYEYCQQDSQHYGDGIAVFPQEQTVLDKLDGKGDTLSLTEADLELIADWMDRAVNRGFGKAVALTGEEQRIYGEIKRLKKEMDGQG